MNNRDYLQLGAILFVPAGHKNIHAMACGEKYPELKSMVIDFEDGLDEASLYDGMRGLRELLEIEKEFVPLLFLRPRNVSHLQELMACEGVEKVEGFILPKFSLQNAGEYLRCFEGTEFYIMPSIEGEELFDTEKLQELKSLLLEYKEKILLVRFGAEDMLKRLAMRRTCHDTLFDFAAVQSILGNFIATFKSSGFAISGGVYPCFENQEGFVRDVLRDLKEGLFSKTIIHPKQIVTCHELYRVSQEEFDEAAEILLSQKVVLAQKGKMAEQHTMSAWSEEILLRGQIYGVN